MKCKHCKFFYEASITFKMFGILKTNYYCSPKRVYIKGILQSFPMIFTQPNSPLANICPFFKMKWWVKILETTKRIINKRRLL